MGIDYDTFEVFLKADKIADISVDYANKKVTVKQYVDNFFRQFYKPDEEVTFDDYLLWLRYRTVDSTRGNIKEYLEEKGLRFYDRLSLFQTTRGRMGQDDIWVRFKGETITWGAVQRESF